MTEPKSKTLRRTMIGVGLAVALGIALLAVIALTVNPNRKDHSAKKATGSPPVETDMATNTDCGFDKVPEHAAAQDPCSPQIGEFDFEWRGIKLNLPPREKLSGHEGGTLNPEEARVTVYLLLQLPLSRTMKYRNERAGIELFFVNRDTGAEFSAHLVEQNMEVPEPGAPTEANPLSAEEMEGRVGRYYYNINALEFVELPYATATYDVHATFEDYESNTMTITID